MELGQLKSLEIGQLDLLFTVGERHNADWIVSD